MHWTSSVRFNSGWNQGLRWLLLAFCFPASVMGAQQPSQSLNDYFKQARDLENKQDFREAERVYLEAMTAYPNQPEILKRLGIIYQTEFKFQESIATFEKILKQAPEYPETNFFLGYSYFGQNLFEKAIEMFQKELAANSKYRRAHYYSGLAFESLNRIGDAIREFEILLKDDPSDTKVLYQLARIHKASSLTAIKQLSHVAPDSVFFHVLRAESYMEDEKYPEAIKEYKLVSAMDPAFPGVHLGLGQVYYKQVNPTESEKEFRLALREDVNHPLANYYLGELLLRALKPREAIPHLRISIDGNPEFVAAYFQLGKCYVAVGQLQEALQVLLKAVELGPNSKMTHYQLAQVYGQLKDTDKRKQHLEIFARLTKEEKESELKKSDRVRQNQKITEGNATKPAPTPVKR
jgi:tetratricopeptide (TPR) repeat protein